MDSITLLAVLLLLTLVYAAIGWLFVMFVLLVSSDPDIPGEFFRRRRTIPRLALLGLLVASCACASTTVFGLLQLLKK